MTIEKINITETIKNVEATLRDDKSISPQVRVMMELLMQKAENFSMAKLA